MRYQDRAEPALEAENNFDDNADGAGSRIGGNINAATGLSTDYLNHFNEAIMLLEMFTSFPDCIDDIHAWRPKTYREHFAASRFRDRAIAIAAYEAADASVRGSLDMLADTMNAAIDTVRAAMSAKLPPKAAATLASRTATALKPLVARAGAIINGELEGCSAIAEAPQAAVDMLFKR